MPNDVVSMFAGRSPNGLPAREDGSPRALFNPSAGAALGSPPRADMREEFIPARGVLAPDAVDVRWGNIGNALLHGTAYGGGSTPGAVGARGVPSPRPRGASRGAKAATMCGNQEAYHECRVDDPTPAPMLGACLRKVGTDP